MWKEFDLVCKLKILSEIKEKKKPDWNLKKIVRERNIEALERTNLNSLKVVELNAAIKENKEEGKKDKN